MLRPGQRRESSCHLECKPSTRCFTGQIICSACTVFCKVSASEEKVAAILNANPLQDASQVRSFVQLVQYSAKFLPNFAQEAEPLRSLLRKNEPFIWGEAQERSFQKLKQLVAQATMLAYFRGDCNTRIIADAGPQGLGAVLTQLQDGEWRAISYASRNLTEVERRYSQTEKEALALA